MRISDAGNGGDLIYLKPAPYDRLRPLKMKTVAAVTGAEVSRRDLVNALRRASKYPVLL
jgi:hypothetical protein